MSSQIFGPVPSRRLGRSLGVDLVPLKTCTYDCIYCQLGRTTCKTMERKEWVPLDGVLESLKEKLSSKPDYITLSGSGEPTLYSRIDKLIDQIKAMTDVPVAVLTNGSLLSHEDVRKQLMAADLVIPSLDAGDEAMFRLINRPHEEISFPQMLDGLIDFAAIFAESFG
jgi:wyosine [tRNA(Phe)-imidazoG37] synthetase (radical SAM superfamily)